MCDFMWINVTQDLVRRDFVTSGFGPRVNDSKNVCGENAAVALGNVCLQSLNGVRSLVEVFNVNVGGLGLRITFEHVRVPDAMPDHLKLTVGKKNVHLSIAS